MCHCEKMNDWLLKQKMKLITQICLFILKWNVFETVHQQEVHYLFDIISLVQIQNNSQIGNLYFFVCFCSSRNILNQKRFLTLAPQEQGSVKEEAVSEVRTRPTWQFDWALNKVDNSVRKTGRIPKSLLLKIFQEMSKAGKLLPIKTK